MAVWRSVWRLTSPVVMPARFNARRKVCATPEGRSDLGLHPWGFGR